MELTQEADILLVSSILQLLHSPDRELAALAPRDLRTVVRRRMNPCPTSPDLVEFFNGATLPQSGDIATCESRTRVAFDSIRAATEVRWGGVANNTPALFLSGEEVLPKKASTIIRAARPTVVPSWSRPCDGVRRVPTSKLPLHI